MSNITNQTNNTTAIPRRTLLAVSVGGVNDPCYWLLFAATDIKTTDDHKVENIKATVVGAVYRKGASSRWYYREEEKGECSDVKEIRNITEKTYNKWYKTLNDEEKPRKLRTGDLYFQKKKDDKRKGLVEIAHTGVINFIIVLEGLDIATLRSNPQGDFIKTFKKIVDYCKPNSI